MSRGPKKFICTEKDIYELERLAGMQDSDPVLSERAKIVLLAYEGHPIKEIATEFGITSNKVIKWRDRYIASGISGLVSKSTHENTAVTDDNRKQLLLALKESPPDGSDHWTADLLAERLNISHDSVWRMLRKEGITLSRQRRWTMESSDSVMSPRITLSGLFLSKGERGIILTLDQGNQKPRRYRIESRLKGIVSSIQNQAGDVHEITLPDALHIASQLLVMPHQNRRKQFRFLEFLDSVMTDFDVTDTPSIHHIFLYQEKQDSNEPEWLIHHSNVMIHRTKDESLWFSQLSTIYCIISSGESQRAKDIYMNQVTSSIHDYVNGSTDSSEPFVWRLSTNHPENV